MRGEGLHEDRIARAADGLKRLLTIREVCDAFARLGARGPTVNGESRQAEGAITDLVSLLRALCHDYIN